MTTIINNFIIYIKDNAKVILCISCVSLLSYIGISIYAHNNQSAMYSQELPANLICIKDVAPDVYLCSKDQNVPWYITKVGVLDHVQ